MCSRKLAGAFTSGEARIRRSNGLVHSEHHAPTVGLDYNCTWRGCVRIAKPHVEIEELYGGVQEARAVNIAVGHSHVAGPDRYIRVHVSSRYYKRNLAVCQKPKLLTLIGVRNTTTYSLSVPLTLI